MDRRTFIKVSCGISGFLVCPYPDLQASVGSKDKPVIRFGMVTDLHYANRKSSGTRYHKHSMDKLHEAITVFNRSNLDFVIELGDFKDQGENPDRIQTLSFLDEIEHEFKKFKGDRYHVLGNHDMDSLSKADFLAHTENSGKVKGKNYYSFVKKKIKFIVLDANYNEDGSDYDLLFRKDHFDWTKTFIPDHEKLWLEKELNSQYPVVVFVHQLLDYFSSERTDVFVKNAAEVVDILERKNNVLAVFQGHRHQGQYSFRNNIHYFTLKGMIEGTFPENNSFAIVEIDKSLNLSINGFHDCEDKYIAAMAKGGYSALSEEVAVAVLSKIGNVSAIAYSSKLNRIVAACGTSVFYSSDAIDWTEVPNVFVAEPKIIYVPEYDTFVAVAFSTNLVIQTSKDGISWIQRKTPGGISSRCMGLAWSPDLGRLVISVDNNENIITSTDLVTFTVVAPEGLPSRCIALFWSDNQKAFFIAALNSTNVYKSTNGLTFTYSGSIVGNDSRFGSDIGTNGMMIVGVAGTSRMCKSTDGASWVGVNNAQRNMQSVFYHKALKKVMVFTYNGQTYRYLSDNGDSFIEEYFRPDENITGYFNGIYIDRMNALLLGTYTNGSNGRIVIIRKS
ncbi:MAG: metallophosphoesterase [Bacteroidales bacterium]|nr:metallophosphoesterase [Bacteroidales bacterium]